MSINRRPEAELVPKFEITWKAIHLSRRSGVVLDAAEQHDRICRKYMDIGKFMDFLVNERLPLSRVDTFTAKAEVSLKLAQKKQILLDRLEFLLGRIKIAGMSEGFERKIRETNDAFTSDIRNATTQEQLDRVLRLARHTMLGPEDGPDGFQAALIMPFVPSTSD